MLKYHPLLYRHLPVAAAVLMAVGGCSLTAAAYPAERYAETSRLASGTWARIRVSETGMQLITSAQLRTLGFSDPSKVRVYGYGGRPIDEALHENHPDDLPMIPSVATAKGVVFFGVDTRKRDLASDHRTYLHTNNAYSQQSYYFISDCDQSTVSLPVLEQAASPQVSLTTFKAQLVHELDQVPGTNSGRVYLGEDLRSQTARFFPFTLTDNVGDNACITVSMGYNISSQASTLTVTANGKEAGVHKYSPISSDQTYYVLSAKSALAQVEGTKLDVGLKFESRGVISLARLDYVEVEYDRALRLNGGELLFYDTATQPTSYTIAGCGENTRVWDVTEPHAPLEVEAKREGDRLTFSTACKGYREYVAFDADKIGRAVAPAGKISNQNIHGLETPDMLIISPREYLAQAERVADLHRNEDGWRVHVLTPETIYNEFSSGVTEVSAFRKLLKMWYDRGDDDGHSIGYCLIMSRPTYDNMLISDRVRADGYPRVPIWQSPHVPTTVVPASLTHGSTYCTDDFIGMLADSNSSSINSQKIQVSVGRMPVKSVAEATAAADKLIKYVKEPTFGSWRNQVMLVADDQDDAIHLIQSEDVWRILSGNGTGPDFNYEKLYIDAYPREASSSGFQYPAAKDRMLQVINDGCLYLNYIGHASPRGWTHDNLFNWTDMNNLNNRNLMFMYTATCEYCRWDDDAVSGAELLWLKPDAGAIGMITTVRQVYMGQNGTLGNYVAKYVFSRGDDGRARRVGDIIRLGKNDIRGAEDNKLRYCVLGDPAMRLPVPQLHVVVDSINGLDLSTGATPQLHASEKVTLSGRIVDAAGHDVPDFNGFVETTLFDAERVVEAPGQGSEGKEQMYNDRNSRLARCREKVTDGRWSATMLTPPLIDNNYSPAMLSAYAYDQTSGIDANGSTTSLYVYGANYDVAEDNDGPQILSIGLNSTSFRDGDKVNSTPVFMASVYDESGISVYGSSVGHELTVDVDGVVYSALQDYFSPTLGEPCGGDLMFPLEQVEPGDHTLTFTVWDNAGNMSQRTLSFRVAAADNPNIYDITTDVNPASTSVTFILSHDRVSENVECLFEVFDLSGRRMWSASQNGTTGFGSDVRLQWNLRDSNGVRVPRGIYLYRATVTTPQGTSCSKTRKLAVTAQ